MSDTNAPNVHLSFSIGPVQGFVAQARRTRDLWAGSWLLSYLAETALAAAEKAGGQAVIPYRPEDARGHVTSVTDPIGGYPNRFEIVFTDQQHAAGAARKAEIAFRSAWQKVTDAVWRRFVAPVASRGNGTDAIWQRQVTNFWELSWVAAEVESGTKTIGHLAACRKLFRNVAAEPEPGTKCSLMGTLQEISGHYGREQRKKQEAFWDEFMAQSEVRSLDIRKGERFCAIALIKRLFPRIIGQAISPEAEKNLASQENWPSTAFIAALPWLKSIEGDPAKLQKARDYADKARREFDWQLSEDRAAREADIPWAGLDAPAWFSSAVRGNEPGKAKDPGPLLKALADLQQVTDGKPIPFYALLLMDGDSMGELLESLGDPAALSEGLHTFAAEVDPIIKEHDGRTIYAGGDDVLAVLPAVHALDAATELCTKYRGSFPSVSDDVSTISGAIVFAHWTFPLRQVLAAAHHLLDDVAKDQTGRDALALGIILGSGTSALWAAPWEAVLGEAEGSHALQSVIDDFGTDESEKELPEFNASYLYHLREQFSRLFDKPLERPGEFGRAQLETGPGRGDILFELAHAEYRRRIPKSRLKSLPPAETRPRIEPLMALTRRWRRKKQNGAPVVRPDPGSFCFDGWRIARFLKQVKEGKLNEHD